MDIMFLAFTIVILCLLLVVVLTRKYRYIDPQWQLASGIGQPTVVILAPLLTNITDLSQLQNQQIDVFYESDLAEYVVEDVFNHYGIRAEGTQDTNNAQLYVFLTDTRAGTPYNSMILELTENRERTLTYVTMLAINGGSSFIRDNEKPFFKAHSHYSKASLDAHGALQDYPHLVVPPLMFSYPTIRARLNLIVRSTNRTTQEQLTAVREMIDQANLERPMFHLDDLAVAD